MVGQQGGGRDLLIVNMTSLQKSLELKTLAKTYDKQANQNIKMATAKSMRTPWLVYKLVPLHAFEALHRLRLSFINTKL
jgi:hypothetical protein